MQSTASKKIKGNIVITSSTLSVTSAPNRCAYTASKHATAGITKQLAVDLAKYDIRVNAIGPGVIRTPLTERYFQDEEASQKVRNLHAMKRWGEPMKFLVQFYILQVTKQVFVLGQI